MGEEREKEEEEKARTSLHLQKSSGREREGVGRAHLLKGPLAPAYVRGDIVAIGPWAALGSSCQV